MVFTSQANGGIAHARNVGLRLATGRYLTFLDGDDLLSDDYLAILRPLLTAGEDDLIDFNYQKFTEQPPTPDNRATQPVTYNFSQLARLPATAVRTLDVASLEPRV